MGPFQRDETLQVIRTSDDSLPGPARSLGLALAVAIVWAPGCGLVEAASPPADPKTHCFDGGRPFGVGIAVCPSRGLRLLCLGIGQRYGAGKIHSYDPRRDGALRFEAAHWVEFAVSPNVCRAQDGRPVRFR